MHGSYLHSLVMGSKRRVRRRSCQTKARYDTYASANGAAKALSRPMYQMHPYKCSFCQAFHIGRPRKET